MTTAYKWFTLFLFFYFRKHCVLQTFAWRCPFHKRNSEIRKRQNPPDTVTGYGRSWEWVVKSVRSRTLAEISYIEIFVTLPVCLGFLIHCEFVCGHVLTHWGRGNFAILQTTHSNACSWMNSDQNFTEVCCPIENNSALVQIMAWRRIGDRPLSKPILARFIDVYMGH